MSRAHPADLPTHRPSCVANTLTLDITRILFNQFFVPAMLIGTMRFYYFIQFFTDFDLVWGHNVSVQQNLFIFSHTFHLISMKFDVVMKQFKLNILTTFDKD